MAFDFQAMLAKARRAASLPSADDEEEPVSPWLSDEEEENLRMEQEEAEWKKKREAAQVAKKQQHILSLSEKVLKERKDLEEYMSTPLVLQPRTNISLDQYKCGDIPTAYYIPEWISEEEEKQILDLTERAPANKWTILRKRSLQNWGGTPLATGMVQEPLPEWLQVLGNRLVETGVFQTSPNHVLLNKYLPGQGIMAHTDGPLYFPRVPILSYGSSTMLSFYKSLADVKSSSPVLSLLLQPRSLLIFEDSLYTDYFHGINEVTEDVVDANVMNAKLAKVELNQVVPRSVRYSLTVRIVPKVGSDASSAPETRTSTTMQPPLPSSASDSDGRYQFVSKPSTDDGADDDYVNV